MRQGFIWWEAFWTWLMKESSSEVRPWLKYMKKEFKYVYKQSEFLIILDIIREFVLSRRSDIELDMENFGDLRPVLLYFLDE